MNKQKMNRIFKNIKTLFLCSVLMISIVLSSLNIGALENNLSNNEQDMIFTGELNEDIDDDVLDQMETYSANQNAYAMDTYSTEEDLSDAVIIRKNIVKINGKEYTGGDVNIVEGTSFSYEFEWELTQKANEGDTICKKIFSVPGLNFADQHDLPAIIYSNNRSIRIGTIDLVYDENTGDLIFLMEFTQYASVFTNIKGYKTGTCSFSMTDSKNDSILVGEYEGKITIVEKEERPPQPSNPDGEGIGWIAPKPPTFNNKVYAFGKGIKWYSEPHNPHTRIEWRAVFLEELQKRQDQFLNENKILLGNDGNGSITEEDTENITKVSLDKTTGNYIIEDTLDENQAFILNNNNDVEYQHGTPFYFEIPIVVVGTGEILNGRVGNDSYDGPGIIHDRIFGDDFKRASNETTDDVEEYVRANPFTWEVVEVEESNGQRKDKLIINIGKLGNTEDDKKGLVLKGEILGNILYKIDTVIKSTKESINSLKNGLDSPIVALKQKSDVLKGKIIDKGWNTEETNLAFEKFDEWYETNYSTNVENRISYMTQEQINSLNEIDLEAEINKIAESFDELNNIQEYLNWKEHFDNLIANQSLYAKNYDTYLKNYEYALGRYQLTRAFYEGGQIYGFSLKYMVDAINPTAKQYTNHIKISSEEKTYEDEDSAKATFSVGVSGEFPIGSVVFKKADSVYQNYENVLENGLANAKFQVYCADGDDETGWSFKKDDDHLGVFAGKDASEGGKAYVWSHHVGDEDNENSGIISTKDGFTVLETDAIGMLALDGLDAAHPHYLVEIEAPEGYYLDSTPLEFQVNSKKVLFKYIPNIARGVKINKVSSYDGQVIQGAEFKVYHEKDNTPLEGGFTKKTITVNGIRTSYYWYDKDFTNQTLATFENGDLNILGLPAGSFYLKETKAASGYELSDKQKAMKYHFTLEKEITDEVKKSLHEENGFYYTYVKNDNQQVITKIYNDQKTKDLTLTKVGKDNKPLTGASFTMLKWIGNEAEWKQNPEQKNLWVTVSMNEKNSLYFNTKNLMQKDAIKVDENGSLTIKDIPNGHYALSETIAPEGYQLLKNWLYFDVDVSNTDKVQLYWNLNQENSIKDNYVPNELYPGALKLYKLVAGNNADLTKLFDFTISLKDANGKPLSGNFNVTWFNQEEDSNAEIISKTGIITLDKNGQCVIPLAHEQGITITGIPAGSIYNIEEKSYSLYNLVMIGGNGTIPSQGTAIATARNRYKTGMLRITKNVNGPKADRNKLFEFDITMKDANGVGINGKFEYMGSSNDGITPPSSGVIEVKDGHAKEKIKLKDGQRISVYGIPDKTECTVKEINNEGYTTVISTRDFHINGKEDSSKSIFISNTGTVHIVDNKRADVNFNNIITPKPGELSISKEVDSMYIDETKEFTFHLHLEDEFGNPIYGKLPIEIRKNMTVLDQFKAFFRMDVSQSEVGEISLNEHGNATFKLKHRDYLIIKELPEGATYTLTEEQTDGYESSINEGITDTIDFTKPAVVAVLNYREEGNLIISKEVSGKGGDFKKDFKFNVNVKHEDGTPLTGTYSYKGSTIEDEGTIEMPEDGFMTFDKEGMASISLKHGQRIIINGLPKGIEYSITEEQDDLYESISTDAKGVIQDITESNARFINRYKTGKLRVIKNVVIGDINKEFTFTVTLSDKNINGEYDEMVFKNGVATFTLKHGESKVATELPAGIKYEVKESDNEGYHVSAINDSGIIKDKEIIRAQFNNTRQSNTRQSNLIINKRVVGNKDDMMKKFVFTIDLKMPDGSPLEGNYSYQGSVLAEVENGNIAPEDGILMFREGKATILLSHGQQIEIKDIPFGCEYKVTEETNDDYTTTYNDTTNVATGTLKETTTISVVNTRKKVSEQSQSNSPGTGDTTNIKVYVALSIISLSIIIIILLLIVLLRKKNRKYIK